MFTLTKSIVRSAASVGNKATIIRTASISPTTSQHRNASSGSSEINYNLKDKIALVTGSTKGYEFFLSKTNKDLIFFIQNRLWNRQTARRQRRFGGHLQPVTFFCLYQKSFYLFITRTEDNVAQAVKELKKVTGKSAEIAGHVCHVGNKEHRNALLDFVRFFSENLQNNLNFIFYRLSNTLVVSTSSFQMRPSTLPRVTFSRLMMRSSRRCV